MLRKDLKPGTIFRYKNDTTNSYVPPMDNPPNNAKMSIAAPGFCWDNEVIVISEPTLKQQVTSLPHYTGKQIEAIDVIEDWGLNFRLANVVKYIARHGRKAGADAKEDLCKAKAYLSREIAALGGRRAWE